MLSDVIRWILVGWLVGVIPLLAGPCLSLSSTQHDFGKIKIDQKSKAIVAIRNDGDEVLIFSVSTTCGCTTTVVGKNEIQSGESSSVEINLDPKGLVGRFTKVVVFTSNDPQRSVMTFNLMGEVEGDFRPNPDTVYVSSCSRGEVRRSRVTLSAVGEKAVRIQAVSNAESPYLRVKSGTKGKDATLDIDFLSKEVPHGQYQGVGTLWVTTENEAQGKVPIRVVWDLKPLVEAKPSRIGITGKAGQEQRVSFVLAHQKGRPVKVINFKSSHEKMGIEWASSGSSARQDCTFVISPGLSAGTYSESIQIVLDDPEQSEVNLHASVVLQ